MAIGVVVTNTETPAATAPSWDTGNAFMVGLADWGAIGPVSVTSQAQISSVVGPRSGTNTVLYDSLDAFFREGGTTAWVSRVTGPAASAASTTLLASGSAAVLLNALYVGEYGSDLRISVTNQTTYVTITLSDTYGNTLATSGQLASRAAIASWANATGYLSAYAETGTALPSTVSNQAFTGGTSDRAGGTNITQFTAALNAIPASLGPGQVLAPGWTDTTVSGIWSALGSHALANNRVALCDIDDNVSAATAISDIGTTYQVASAGPIGFWAGNLSAPGVVSGTTRSIPPSCVVAALCARVDAAGNPNQAAAGSSYPLQYCSGPASVVSGLGANQTYSAADINTLQQAGINTFAYVQSFQNYGFWSSLPETVDSIYFQLSHVRLRMAITASAQLVAQPYLFSQIDGQGSDILSFGSSLGQMLKKYYGVGALYGSTPGQAYAVDVTPAVNPPANLQKGILSANLAVRMSPFAQLIPINVNSVPITGSIVSSGN